MADRNQADAVGKLFQSQVLDALSPELAEALTSPKVAQALADIDPAKLRGTDVARRIAAAIDPAKISFVTAELAKHFPSALNLYERLAKALTTNSQQQRSTADVTEAKPLSERGRVGLKRQAAIRQLLTEGWVPGDSRTWREFYDAVRDRCRAWKDRKEGKPKRVTATPPLKKTFGV